MTGLRARRGLVGTVGLAAAGAGVALLAAGSTWAVDVVTRPDPLPAQHTTHTGGDLVAWLPAAAWVALAGAGALLATGGRVRVAVGGLVGLAGVAVLAGGVAAATRADVAAGWPALVVLGGLAVVAAGLWAVLRGGRWPGMAARYERRGAARRGRDPAAHLWDALDRGEDPTAVDPAADDPAADDPAGDPGRPGGGAVGGAKVLASDPGGPEKGPGG